MLAHIFSLALLSLFLRYKLDFRACNLSHLCLVLHHFHLRYREPVGYILKEDEDRIYLERSLGFLLQESED
jgi:hypothetical protein